MKVQESSPGYDVLAQSASADKWTLVPLKGLGKWSGGGTPSKSKLDYWEDGTIPWVSPKDMKTDHIVDSEDHITEAAVEESTAKLIPAGSILIVTRSGILSHTLPVAVTTVPVTVNQDLKALTPREGVLPEYVAWALRCFAREILNTCSKQGTTVSSIETAALHRFKIPVAPLAQQKRIVAEIEKQFSRLDEAVANLKRVKANLKRYKAAVLKAAVEGRLVETEAELARREGRSYETGAQLLQRILETRRSQWQGKGKYKEPAAPDTTDLPELPEGWGWATVQQLATHVQYGHTASAVARDSGVRFLRITDIQDDSVDWSAVPSCDIADDDLRELLLKPGDIVFARTGATVGKSFQLKGQFPDSVFASYLIRISPGDRQASEWLNVFFHSPEYWAQIRESQVGIGQPNVNGTKLQALVVPLPPVAEQHLIVAELDRRFSLMRETEAQVDANLQRAARLRQSVLQSSFRPKEK